MKFSIAIVAYNVEKYIEEALASATAQSYKNIEILCVDDASTDGTLGILRSGAAEDERIRVIEHQKNMGTLVARSSAVKEATGDYIIFLDGDDFLHPDTCRILHEQLAKKRVDVLQFGAELYGRELLSPGMAEGLERSFVPCKEPLPACEGALVESCVLDKKFSHAQWGKAFSAAAAKKAYAYVADERITMAEDMLMTIMILAFCKGYGSVDNKLYFYRQGSGVTFSAESSLLKRARAFSEEYLVIGCLEKWLREAGVFEDHSKAFEEVKRYIYSDFVSFLFFSVTDIGARKKVFGILREHWPWEDVFAAINHGVYDTRVIKAEDVVWGLRFLKGAKKRQIKTVGMYYSRLRNGGVERVMALLSRIFDEGGYRVVLFTDEEETAEDYPVPNHIKRVVLPKLSSDDTGRMALRSRVLTETLIDNGIDILVYHYWLNDYLMVDQLAIKSIGLPLVLDSHGVFSVGFDIGTDDMTYKAAAQVKLYALFDAVATLSQVNEAWWKALGFKGKWIFNPPTFPLKDTEPAELKSSDALIVSRLSFEKQIEDAIYIAKAVHDAVPEFRLRIVGKGETREDIEPLERLIAQLGAGDYVILEGFHKDVAPFYRESALLLCTSQFEGSPMAMAEAKIFGLPVVTYELPAVEYLRRGEGMVVVPQRDISAAARAITEMLQNRDKLRAMGEASRNSAEEYFGDAILARWKELFDEVFCDEAEETPLYRLPPIETAVRVAMMSAEKYLDIEKKHVASLEQAIVEIQNSTAYRLGRFITMLPRYLKRKLSGAK